MMMASVVKGGAVGAQPDEAASTIGKGGLALDEWSQDGERSDSLAEKENRGVAALTIYSPAPPAPYVLHFGKLVIVKVIESSDDPAEDAENAAEDERIPRL